MFDKVKAGPVRYFCGPSNCIKVLCHESALITRTTKRYVHRQEAAIAPFPRWFCVLLLPLVIVVAGNLHAQVIDTSWVRYYNGDASDDDAAKYVELDRWNNAIVSGTSYDSLGRGKDIFVLKYSIAGKLLWRETWDGGESDDEVFAMQVDSLGNTYLTGSSKSSGTSECFTLKYDASGALLWERMYHGEGRYGSAGYGLLLSRSGNIYVSGGTGRVRAYNLLLMKYNPDGEIIWTYENKDTLSASANIDETTNGIVCVGLVSYYQRTSDSTDYYHGGSFIISSFDPDGTQLWMQSLYSYQNSGVISDNPTSWIYQYFQTIVSDTISYIILSDYDVFTGVNRLQVAAIGEHGQRLYILSPPGTEQLYSLVASSTPRGSVIIALPHFSPDYQKVTLIEIRNSADFRIYQATRGPAYHYYTLDDMEFDSSGNVYFSGYIRPWGASENQNGYVTKLNADFTFGWIQQLDGVASLDDEFSALAVDQLGGVVTVGTSNRGVPNYTDAVAARYFELPLRVARTTPRNFAASVSSSAEIKVYFNQALDWNSVSDSSVTIRGDRSGYQRAHCYYNQGESSILIVPTEPLFAGETVRIVVSPQLRAAAGKMLEGGYSWTFSMAAGGTGLYEQAVQLSPPSLEIDDLALGYFTCDIDDDGDEDVLLANTHIGSELRMFVNRGRGDFDFQEIPLQYFSYYEVLGLGDFDNNGLTDMVLASGSGNFPSIVIVLNQGNLEFATGVRVWSASDQTTLSGVIIRDVDNDLDLDLLISVGTPFASRPPKFVIATNNGAASFTVSSETSTDERSGSLWLYGGGFILDDLDGDGLPDLSYTNRERLFIRYSELGSPFSQLKGFPSTQPLKVFPVHSWTDSLPQVMAVSQSGVLSFLQAFKERRLEGFLSIGSCNPYAIEFGDLNGDSFPDFLQKCHGLLRTYMNDTEGNYTVRLDEFPGWNTRENSTHLFDADGDGDLDIIDNRDSSWVIYRNLSGVLETSDSSIALSFRSDTPGGDSVTIELSSMTDTVAYSVGSPLWLAALPASGTTPQQLYFHVGRQSMTPGRYRDTVDIWSDGAINSPLKVVVDVSYVGTTLQSLPNEIAFDAVDGIGQASVLLYADFEDVDFALSTPATWVEFSQPSGKTPASITLSADTSGLLQGTYQDTVFVGSSRAVNSPLKIPVRLRYPPGRFDLYVFPIPAPRALGSIKFAVATPVAGRISLSIYDAGLVRKSHMHWNLQEGQQQLDVSLDDLAPGVYMYEYEFVNSSGVRLDQGSGKFIVTED